MKRMNDRSGRMMTRLLAGLLAMLSLCTTVFPALAEDATPAPTAEVTVAPAAEPAVEDETAQSVLTRFFEAWAQPDAAGIEAMLALTAPSWRAAQEEMDLHKQMFILLRNRAAKEYEIVSISGSERDMLRTAEVKVLMDKMDGSEPEWVLFRVVVLKEDGQWYIDPRFLASAVDAAETAGEATPAPTAPASTATPKPVPLGISDLVVQEALAQQDTAQEAAFSNAAISGALYRDFTFGSVQTLHGIFSTISLYAELPEYVTPKDAVLRLSYTASSLILDEVSSLTFYMNGSPFASITVYPSIEQSETVRYITVPANLLQNGYNLLEIEAYVRLTDDDEGCTDDYNGANWVKINEETCLRVLYDVLEDTTSLALYPFPFISITDTTGAQCAVTVSDAADEAELTAALALMGDLGSAVSSKSELAFGRLSDMDRSNVIYFGLEKNTPDAILKLIPEQIPATGALVRRATTENREYLLVVAQEEAALLEAARYLGDATRVEQTEEAGIHITVGEAQTYIEARRKSGLALEGQYTLKDILGHGASFTGPFHQEMTLYLPLAQDYALSSESRFSFKIRYSENLDFDRSIMTVYWGNDIPLYSRKLSKEGAAGDTVSFAVPADAVGEVSTSMVIAFDLEIKDLDCTPRQLNMPWAYIAEDSTLYLPQGTSTALSLGTLPVPFQRNNMFNDMLLILPDDASSTELMLAGRVMNMLGVGSEPYGTMEAIYASSFGPAYHDRHIVVLGTPSTNPLLHSLNGSLFFKYTENGKAVESNDKLILDSVYATQVGTLQMLNSPYLAGRSLLVISAPAEAGLNALIDRISEETKRWSLAREAVLVDGRGKATSYQFTVAEVNEAVQKPSFTKIVMENREPMLMMIVGLGCMLLLLLTVILVLVRIRVAKREE